MDIDMDMDMDMDIDADKTQKGIELNKSLDIPVFRTGEYNYFL